jgi:acyl-ACP thioesterase
VTHRAAPRPAPLDPGLAGVQDRPVAAVDNGFVAGYRVRFDEAGPDGLMRTSALLRYAQDVAWRHSEDLGFDRAWYAERGRSWVVRSVDLRVLSPIAMGLTLRVATAVVGHKRIWARRRGEFRLPDGNLAAVASTDWVLLDHRGRIVRIPDVFGVAFPNVELSDEILRVRLPASPDDATRLSIRVRPHDLDPLGHVNNAVYLDWIEEAVSAVDPGAAAAAPRRIAIEYAASAESGDVLEAVAWPARSACCVRLERPDGSELVRARVEVEDEADSSSAARGTTIAPDLVRG